LIAAFLDRDHPEKSEFLRTLFDKSYATSWESLKKIIEWAQQHIQNWQQSLGVTPRIRSDQNPDNIIRAVLAELGSCKYLFLRGFRTFIFNETGIDIQATFDSRPWNIEVTYISGQDFKTQTKIKSKQDVILPAYALDSHKLINRLKSKYQEEKDQLARSLPNLDNCLIIIVTHLLETYAPWLEHEADIHPIDRFVQSCEIPTVVIGSGTIYEPEAPFVKGRFPIELF
jgi:hypothetical protein